MDIFDQVGVTDNKEVASIQVSSISATENRGRPVRKSWVKSKWLLIQTLRKKETGLKIGNRILLMQR